ncbi:MAG: T9SS type A sorting domain-containing protein [Bacteroidetes bacterium]|nr:T9SS type A sorting domain-containing protein [Bacteroidota bacterium]
MKKTLLLGTALMVGAAGFAQSGAKARATNPKYLEKKANYGTTVMVEPQPSLVSNNAKKGQHNSVQSSCGLPKFTTSWNCFGTGGGSSTSSQSCLSYNSDLNTLIWTQRGSKTWAINATSGFVQATLINPTTKVKTDSINIFNDAGANTYHARYPSGVILNTPGNNTLANAYAVGFAQVTNGTNWTGTAYSAKPLWSASAVGHTVAGADSLYAASGTVFGNNASANLTGAPAYDVAALQGTSSMVSIGQLLDPSFTGSDNASSKGFVFVKGTINSGTKLVNWTVDSIMPAVHKGALGYQLGLPRMAFGPDGQTGYVVMLARMAATYSNTSADSAMTPIVYKSTDGGNTWNLQTALLGYNWMCHHPEVEKNVGELVPMKRFYTFNNYAEGADVTVDKNGMLHYVTTVTESTFKTGNIDSLGIYSPLYDYDFLHHHPIIWDFTTNGSDWETMMVDSILCSSIGSSSTDTTSSKSPMGGSQILGVHAHIQVSRSADGSMIFYGWADSDTNVVAPNAYGQRLNTNPDVMMKAYNVTSGMLTATKNTTGSSPYTGTCFYPYLSDISINTAGTNWMVPAVFTTGDVVTSSSGGYPIYDASSQADYYYSDCGTFMASDFSHPAHVYTSPIGGPCTAMGIKTNNAFESSIMNYPNPFNGTTTIAVTLTEAKSFSVNVYNAIGALVYSKSVNGNVGTNNVTFDGSSFNAGVYYYTVNAGNQQATKKMIIAK